MKRKIIDKLIEWKNSSERKPLILQGARQIGKTYIVNQFGMQEYSNFVYCNFEKEKELSSLFSDLSPENIIKKLSFYKRKEIFAENTLLIFDEIQACPEALTSLKYFCEEANQFHIIALGSLLGVSVNRGESSFPVGKVQFLNMFPMDFEEYLMAKDFGIEGQSEFLINRIKECFEKNTPIEEAFHNQLMEIYKEYLFIGGLPEVVLSFNENKNPVLADLKKSDILEAYQNDMGKYNRQSEISKTKLVYKSISTQLSKENKKFQYKNVKSGGRASEFEAPIEWLNLAGIANQIYRLEQIKLPLNAYRSLSDFKFYMNDAGLCCSSQKILYEDIFQENPMLSDFKGGLTENYVANQLTVHSFELFYWTSGNQAEVDFVTRINGEIIPIEVKSSEHTRSRSLEIYKKTFSPSYAIRISPKNFGFENGIKSIPLYSVFCLK